MKTVFDNIYDFFKLIFFNLLFILIFKELFLYLLNINLKNYSEVSENHWELLNKKIIIIQILSFYVNITNTNQY